MEAGLFFVKEEQESRLLVCFRREKARLQEVGKVQGL